MSIAKGTVHQHARDGVALLTIDAPPVNALSHPVRKALCDALRRAIDDAAITAVVLAGANRAFVAGADLSELGAPLAHPDIRELFAAVDACPKPVVAAIGGMALGGGLELALCCDRRVAASHASLGLPEVTLGLLPGGGGTQRLPRLLGLEEAANLILTGKILPARRAAALGIVDEVVEGDEVEAAVEWARELGQRGPSALRRLGRMPMPTAGRGPVTLLAEAYAAAVRRMPRRFALEMIVQCLEAAATAPDFAAGMAVEAACFEQCHAHPQHRALLHLFFAERACAKLPGVGRDVEARPVRTAVLVGGGAHAEGLAASLVEAGVELLEPARLREADVVLATGDDEPAARREALARIDREARPGALLVAVGTALDLDALAQAVHRPAELVGLDLGLTSPSSRARLVQVIRGSKTGAEALVTAMRLGKRLGKIAVAVRSAPGLVGERVRARLHREIEALCAEGVSRARVHHVLERFGPSLVPVLDDELELPSGPHVAGPAILERCLGAMADEASRLLAEGVAARASDVDVICVHGYGFPDVAGGPLHWAEQQALARRRPAERGDARRTAPSSELRNLRAS